MKTKLSFLLILSAVASALMFVGSGCATTSEGQTTSLLSQAGFKTMVATTFEKQQKLKSLKADRISTVKSTNGTVYYVYPLHAQDLLYVGRAPEYAAYQNLLATMQAQEATLKAEQRGADTSWSQQAEGDESWRDVWAAPSDF